MNKLEWQLHHEITDEELSFITLMRDESYGTIIKVSEVPKTPSGDPVAFSNRDEPNTKMHYLR